MKLEENAGHRSKLSYTRLRYRNSFRGKSMGSQTSSLATQIISVFKEMLIKNYRKA